MYSFKMKRSRRLIGNNQDVLTPQGSQIETRRQVYDIVATL